MSCATDKFSKQYGDGAVERIFYNIYGDRNDADVVISEHHYNDAINSTGSGFFYPDGDDSGREVSFSFTDGNVNGSSIDEFSEAELVGKKYYATIYKLRIDVDINNLEHAHTVAIIFDYWRDKQWFKDIENGATYDFRFSPTDKIRAYWDQKAAQRTLRLEPEFIEVQP